MPSANRPGQRLAVRDKTITIQWGIAVNAKAKKYAEQIDALYVGSMDTGYHLRRKSVKIKCGTAMNMFHC